MHNDRRTVLAGLVASLAVPLPARAAGVRLDPREFGARGDGAAKDTAALQQALDRCTVLGGGQVVLAGGSFLSGALRIGSNTTLRIDAGARLLGSPDLADYPLTQVRWEGRWVQGRASLISAQDEHDIAIEGSGAIVGGAIPGRVGANGLRNPALMEFVDVSGLRVTDLHVEEGDMWAIHPVYCEGVTFRGLTIKGGADGIDVDSCRRVTIDACDFDTADDCISLKSGRGLEGATIARPTEDVTITGCTFRDRRWACIGIGSETSGGIRRVVVERCRFLAAHTFAVYIKSRPGRGAFIEDIMMRDLEVGGTGDGFLRLNFLDSGKQDQFPVPGRDGIPTVRNLRFERIRVTGVPKLVEATSIHPDKPLRGFVLHDISGTAGQGMALANMRGVSLRNVDVAVATGPKLAITNVLGSGLAGAAALPPVTAPPPVAATGPYRLGMDAGTPN